MNEQYEYSKFPNRGQCYIFNHEEFDLHTNLEKRDGTNKDGDSLYCLFKYLGFTTYLFRDYTVREVMEKLTEASKEDHSDNSCFVCCIMSHGEHGMLYAKDGKYLIEDVFEPFKDDICPTLRDKPRMFFIQACQGDLFDEGVAVKCQESLDAAMQDKSVTHPDFLIVYSTVPGFYSWRNKSEGSWFIQSFCEALKIHADDKNILQLLTIVNRMVAFSFESFTRQKCSNKKKQVPCITSTLTRVFKFS